MNLTKDELYVVICTLENQLLSPEDKKLFCDKCPIRGRSCGNFNYKKDLKLVKKLYGYARKRGLKE